MPTNTYVALRTEVLTSATPSVTLNLSGITGYTDLVLVITAQASVSTNLQMRFNGSSAAYYSNTGMRGYSTSTADSFRQTNLSSMTLTTVEDIGNPNTNIIIQIPNYSNTTTFKSALVRANQATAGTEAIVGLWRGTTGSDTPAITSITLLSGGGNLLTGSTFTIYGIAASSVGAKATGGDIYSDSSYYYHVFDSNGTFTPTQSISADVLVVAGGGGGGSGGGGGGGAGGLLGYTAQSLTATGYSITVGAGGAGGTSNAKGANGNNSQFAALTASVAGGGGSGYAGSGNSASSGGSGGGGAGSSGGGASATGAAGTSGQGFAGGNGNTDGGAGGGGGSGAIGTNGTNGVTGVGGNGGTGVSTYSSWLSATGIGSSGFIAGGGGGGGYASVGTGGAGGGANGGTVAAATTAGLIASGSGGGGGGAGSSWAGSAGGSGVVIVRYAK
jgi:hypothetical protein